MTIETTAEGNSVIYKLTGKLDTVTSSDLKAATSQTGADVTEMIFDLEELSYISSAGIRVFLECIRKMNKVNGKVIVKNANDIVKEVFNMTGFSNLLTIE